jgi:hypothetical protein
MTVTAVANARGDSESCGSSDGVSAHNRMLRPQDGVVAKPALWLCNRPDWIRCVFRDQSPYRYDAQHPGTYHVKRMQELAIDGTGLTTYINQHVRNNDSRRER